MSLDTSRAGWMICISGWVSPSEEGALTRPSVPDRSVRMSALLYSTEEESNQSPGKGAGLVTGAYCQQCMNVKCGTDQGGIVDDHRLVSPVSNPSTNNTASIQTLSN